MDERLSLKEVFVFLPKLMLLKKNGKIHEPVSIYGILKILNLNPRDGKNYSMVKRWGEPSYLFIKNVKNKKSYMIEDKTFWRFISRNFATTIQFIKYLETKATIVED